jgi:hypothetical protein
MDITVIKIWNCCIIFEFDNVVSLRVYQLVMLSAYGNKYVLAYEFKNSLYNTTTTWILDMFTVSLSNIMVEQSEKE